MPNVSPDEFRRIVTLEMPDRVTALTFSPDGALLAVATGDKVHVFEVPETARPTNHGQPRRDTED